MLTTNARRARQVAGWASLACAALLVTACNSSSGMAAASASSPVSAAATGASSPGSPSSASSVPSGPASETGTSTFLAQGQDLNGTALYMPTCHSGCSLSGDGTAILDKITWGTWSATEAVGMGTYELDGCHPNCAAGPIYPVATVVTLSDPVKVCSSSGTHWFWTRASFKFPNGLPEALQSGSAPNNPWVFSTVVAAAQQSCAS